MTDKEIYDTLKRMQRDLETILRELEARIRLEG